MTESTSFCPRISHSFISSRSGLRIFIIKNQNTKLYLSFLSAIFSCLCAGSINAFSLYGHLFQERLNYTQTQVNIVSVAAELANYLPISLAGVFCDNIGPDWASLLSAFFFGIGYITAAFNYQNGTKNVSEQTKPNDSSVQIMVVAFIFIGFGCPLMYLSAITTCARNFRTGKLRGLAIASPIAAIGLSSFWQSQVGSRLFSENPSKNIKGDVDVFSFFIFLAITLIAAGLVGFFLLKIIDEDILMDKSMEQDERSRLLENREFFDENHITYDPTETTLNHETMESHGSSRIKNMGQAYHKKYVLSEHTIIFLKDHTMWWFAAGFFFVSGPCEMFITNMGTIIGSLYPLHKGQYAPQTDVATHVSIVSICSTVARLTFSTLTDILLLKPGTQRDTADSSLNRSPGLKEFLISRITYLVGSGLFLSFGQILLASGLMQNHAEHFWIVSVVSGIAYGALFSLTPIIISIIWGVDSFGTNWGIIGMIPAMSTTFWSFVYSSIYEAGVRSSIREHDNNGKFLCHGKICYSNTFWAMAGSVWLGCVCWIWAWRGTQGWAKRGITI